VNREMLAVLLIQFEIRPYAYDLYWRGTESEVYAIAHEQDGWHVFYAERGIRTGERVHAAEADACDDLLMRIGKDPLTRSDRQ
jgi:hypothetical protein